VVNHGIAPDELPVDQMTDARWRHTLAVNLDRPSRHRRTAITVSRRVRTTTGARKGH
jgi:hypothetical protein